MIAITILLCEVLHHDYMFHHKPLKHYISQTKPMIHSLSGLGYRVKRMSVILLLVLLSTTQLPEIFAQQLTTQVTAVAKRIKKQRVINLHGSLDSALTKTRSGIDFKKIIKVKKTKTASGLSTTGSVSGACIWDMSTMQWTGLQMYTGLYYSGGLLSGGWSVHVNQWSGSWSGFDSQKMLLSYGTGVMIHQNVIDRSNYLVYRRCQRSSGIITYPGESQYLSGLLLLSGGLQELPRLFTGVSINNGGHHTRIITEPAHFSASTQPQNLDNGMSYSTKQRTVQSPKEFMSEVDRGTIVLQRQSVKRPRDGGKSNKLYFTNDIIYTNSANTVQAEISADTIIFTAQGEELSPSEFVVRKKSILTKEGIEMKDTSLVSTFIDVGTQGTHLIFTKPVLIQYDSDLPDGSIVAIQVQHAGQDWSTQGLSVSASSSCDLDGNTNKPVAKTTVQGGQVSFYTCGASTFAVSYLGGPFVNNYVDAASKDYSVTVTTGTALPTGATVSDVNVLVDFRPIDNESPTGPWGTTNCFPGEKSFQLVHPDGTIVALSNPNTYTTPNTSCPQAQINYDQQASTAIVGGAWALSGQLRRPVGNLNTLNGKSPFGIWKLRMTDNAGSDGVILYGFTITINDTGLVSTGDIIPPVLSGLSLSGQAFTTTSIAYNLRVTENLSLTGAGFASGSIVNVAGTGTCSSLSVSQYITNNSGVTAITIVSSISSGSFSNCFLMIRDRANLQSNFLPLGTFSIASVVTGTICIQSPTIGSFSGNSSSTGTSLAFQFDYFSVDDNKGSNSGYYTTLTLPSLVKSGGGILSNTSIQWRGDPITLLSGTINPRVVLATGMQSYTGANTTVTFIKRDAAANSSIKGLYGSKLRLTVTIPPYQAIGTYTGTITYTLYEN